MIFGSVCSGIEAASTAWLPLGLRCSFMSEIEPSACAVLQSHYGDTPLHGDFTTIEAGQYAGIDILVGGTPCQSFSVAGLRGGMADARGNLALEYLRLADRLRPRWVVWENVPGVLSSNAGRDFGAFVGGLAELGYGWAYRVLDAQYFGLAQRRKRVFVVGCLGDWRRAASVLFEPASLRGDSAPRREAREKIAGTLAARARSGGGFGTDFECDGGLVAETLTGNGDAHSGFKDEIGLVAMALNAHGNSGRMDGESETFVADFAPALSQSNPYGDHESREGLLVAHSLRADGYGASEDGTGRGTPLTLVGTAVRRLTPRECERLQGFPDNYTLIPWRGKPMADGPRYRLLGNSMAVPVMAWIGRRIAAS